MRTALRTLDFECPACGRDTKLRYGHSAGLSVLTAVCMLVLIASLPQGMSNGLSLLSVATGYLVVSRVLLAFLLRWWPRPYRVGD